MTKTINKFSKKVDLRNREEMVKFLTSHFRYHTMNSWNNATSYAHNVKLYNFESLCAFGVRIYLKAETMTTDAIAYCINDLVNEEGKTVEEILEMDKWDFIDKASNWL